MVILYKTDSTQFLEKNLAVFFARQTVPKIHTLKGSRIAKAILKKNTAGGPPS